MEGASGVVSEATMDAAQPDSFAVGRASVIDDVNAVVAGLFDGGATQVDVENTHGEGGDSLVPRERLDKRAGVVARSQLDPYILGPRPGQPGFGSAGPRPPYDVVVTVGMHDKPRSGGFSPHTLGAGITPIIDGRAVTEAELVGYNLGRFGIPVIYASGDDRLQATLAATMPWVEYAVVKRITAPTVAQPLPREQVQRTLHDAAVRAMRAMDTPGKMRVMQLSAPFRAGLLPSYPLLLPPGIGSLPGIAKRGDTVTFMANDYPSAYWGMFVLQRIARALSVERAFFEVARDSGGMAAVKRATDSSWARWAAFEAGKWTPP
jgi:D-amino peptidase